MSQTYSQWRALSALTKGSLLAMLKSPSAIFFSIAFPLIFIVAFGLISDSGFSVDVVMDTKSDTNNVLYRMLTQSPVVNIVTHETSSKEEEQFRKGNIAARILIEKTNDNIAPFYRINLQSSLAAGTSRSLVSQIIKGMVDSLNKSSFPNNQEYATVLEAAPIEGRPYKYLDFFLPGMLGFSLLSAGIFGTAFVFFTLRQTLVLKRFFATPVRRFNIILSEGISRLLLQLLSACIIIGVGYAAFDFTLLHGWITFLQMIILCIIGLILFIGMGFVISSLAKNDAMIPPIANMITMPQLLLSGVFLGVSNFPSWLQPICKLLPLTQFNDAMRAIAFEGKSLLACTQQLGILAIWIVIVYVICIKVFRWE